MITLGDIIIEKLVIARKKWVLAWFFQFEENKSMMFLDDTKSVRKCFPGPKTLIWAHDDILESFLRFFQQPKILHKISFFWRNADFFMKKLIFLPSWQFFYESIWHLRMCPLSFEYFGTLSKTSRAKFLISSFILKKINFFDLHGLKKLQILTKSLSFRGKHGRSVS